MKVNASQRSIGRHPTTAIEAAPTQPPVAHRFAFFEQPLAAWTREYRDVLIAFISSRLLIVMLMGFSTMIVAPGENGPRRGFAGILTQGDGARYVEIASAGYGTGEEARAKAGLFPLYPSLVATVSIVVRDATISAILVSNLALLGAGMLLKELLERHYASRSVSRAGLTFLMFGPVSFFFSGAYPEATLLMFTIAALLAADMQRWKIAAAAGACASATSAVGVIVLLPLAWEYIVARRERRAPGATIADGLLLVIVPLGCAAVLAVSWFRTGDALAPLSATDVFRGGLVPPWTALSMTALIPPFYRAFTLLMIGAAVALCCAGIFLKVRPSYLLYAGALIAIYACSPALPSIARSLSVVLPMYIVLAALTKRLEWTFEPLLACSFTVLSFCTVLLANGHWMR